jgi:hypothetical protein
LQCCLGHPNPNRAHKCLHFAFFAFFDSSRTRADANAIFGCGIGYLSGGLPLQRASREIDALACCHRIQPSASQMSLCASKTSVCLPNFLLLWSISAGP